MFSNYGTMQPQWHAAAIRPVDTVANFQSDRKGSPGPYDLDLKRRILAYRESRRFRDIGCIRIAEKMFFLFQQGRDLP